MRRLPAAESSSQKLICLESRGCDMAEHYQLKCRECGKLWGNQARSFCDECLSPLEVSYDLEAIRPIFTRKNIEAGPANLWRYSALLPLPEGYEGTLPTGF